MAVRCILMATVALAAALTLLPAAVVAAPPETTEEVFVEAHFSAEDGCYSHTIDVMGSTLLKRSGKQAQEFASVQMSVFSYDQCSQQVILSSSGYQAIAMDAIRISGNLRQGKLTAIVPMFIPIGPGYLVDVSISMTFNGRGKIEKDREHSKVCANGHCKHHSLTSQTRSVSARAKIIFPDIGEPKLNAMDFTSLRTGSAHVTLMVTKVW